MPNFNSLLIMSRPNLRIVSKLTTDVVTYRYCTEASNQKSKYAYRKIFFKKKHCLRLITCKSVIEPELWLIKVYIAERGILDVFCSCDLDLDPMTFIYELHPYCRIPWRYSGCAITNFLHEGFQKLLSDRQTGARKIIYHTALRMVKNTSYKMSTHM